MIEVDSCNNCVCIAICKCKGTHKLLRDCSILKHDIRAAFYEVHLNYDKYILIKGLYRAFLISKSEHTTPTRDIQTTYTWHEVGPNEKGTAQPIAFNVSLDD